MSFMSSNSTPNFYDLSSNAADHLGSANPTTPCSTHAFYDVNMSNDAILPGSANPTTPAGSIFNNRSIGATMSSGSSLASFHSAPTQQNFATSGLDLMSPQRPMLRIPADANHNELMSLGLKGYILLYGMFQNAQQTAQRYEAKFEGLLKILEDKLSKSGPEYPTVPEPDTKRCPDIEDFIYTEADWENVLKADPLRATGSIHQQMEWRCYFLQNEDGTQTFGDLDNHHNAFVKAHPDWSTDRAEWAGFVNRTLESFVLRDKVDPVTVPKKFKQFKAHRWYNELITAIYVKYPAFAIASSHWKVNMALTQAYPKFADKCHKVKDNQAIKIEASESSSTAEQLEMLNEQLKIKPEDAPGTESTEPAKKKRRHAPAPGPSSANVLQTSSSPIDAFKQALPPSEKLFEKSTPQAHVVEYSLDDDSDTPHLNIRPHIPPPMSPFEPNAESTRIIASQARSHRPPAKKIQDRASLERQTPPETNPSDNGGPNPPSPGTLIPSTLAPPIQLDIRPVFSNTVPEQPPQSKKRDSPDEGEPTAKATAIKRKAPLDADDEPGVNAPKSSASAKATTKSSSRFILFRKDMKVKAELAARVDYAERIVNKEIPNKSNPEFGAEWKMIKGNPQRIKKYDEMIQDKVAFDIRLKKAREAYDAFITAAGLKK